MTDHAERNRLLAEGVVRCPEGRPMTDTTELRRLLDEMRNPSPFGGPSDYASVPKAVYHALPALLDELDRLKGELRVARLLGYPVCKRHAVNDYVDLRPDSPGCPFCLYDENATLKSTLAGVRALPERWRKEAMEQVPEAYAIRNLRRKYLNTDCMAGGIHDCADELQAKLGEV